MALGGQRVNSQTNLLRIVSKPLSIDLHLYLCIRYGCVYMYKNVLSLCIYEERGWLNQHELACGQTVKKNSGGLCFYR